MSIETGSVIVIMVNEINTIHGIRDVDSINFFILIRQCNVSMERITKSLNMLEY